MLELFSDQLWFVSQVLGSAYSEPVICCSSPESWPCTAPQSPSQIISTDFHWANPGLTAGCTHTHQDRGAGDGDDIRAWSCRTIQTRDLIWKLHEKKVFNFKVWEVSKTKKTFTDFHERVKFQQRGDVKLPPLTSQKRRNKTYNF